MNKLHLSISNKGLNRGTGGAGRHSNSIVGVGDSVERRNSSDAAKNVDLNVDRVDPGEEDEDVEERDSAAGGAGY